MPMDPFSALSLAATVVQFVDFSTKVISKGNALWKSYDGSLSENSELECVTLRFQNLTKNLRAQARQTGPTHNANGDQSLENICESCIDIAEELCSRLNQLKVSPSHPQRRWKSIRQALKSVWSKEKLQELEGRLARFKDDLNLHIIVALKYVHTIVTWQESSKLCRKCLSI